MLLDFLYFAGISLLGAKFWGLWGKMTPKRQMREKHLLGETFLRQTASFEPLCVKLSLSVWPVQVHKKKGSKALRQEEKSQEV